MAVKPRRTVRARTKIRRVCPRSRLSTACVVFISAFLSRLFTCHVGYRGGTPGVGLPAVNVGVCSVKAFRRKVAQLSDGLFVQFAACSEAETRAAVRPRPLAYTSPSSAGCLV